MGLTLTEKILRAHIVDGEFKKGAEIGLKIDQTLTQDATGTMAYLEFEAMGVPPCAHRAFALPTSTTTPCKTALKTRTTTASSGSVAKKHGIYFSPPGQRHLPSGAPGALRRAGQDADRLGQPHAHRRRPRHAGHGRGRSGRRGRHGRRRVLHHLCRRSLRSSLTGKLRPWVSAKDVILEVLRRLSVKGGVGKIMEYGGEGVKTLSVPERATITNMGAELGATTSIFPSDEITRAFLARRRAASGLCGAARSRRRTPCTTRRIDHRPLRRSTRWPHVRIPPTMSSRVAELGDMKVDQVCIGSCTNSSLCRYDEGRRTSCKGKTVAPDVSASPLPPAPSRCCNMLAENGALADMIAAGARMLECACGPCIGMGQSPNSGGVSLRTFNRNFEGRSGTTDAQVYLVSPRDRCGRSAADRRISPTRRRSGDMPAISMPEHVPHQRQHDRACPHPRGGRDKRGDPARAQHQALPRDAIRWQTTSAAQGVAQGGRQHHHRPHHARGREDPALSLQHPAICPSSASASATRTSPSAPRQRGRASSSAARTTARAPRASTRRWCRCIWASRRSSPRALPASTAANLINAGILPLTFADPADYDKLAQGDELVLAGHLCAAVEAGSMTLTDQSAATKSSWTAPTRRARLPF